MSITQPVSIYQPSDAEITGVLSTARTAWPTLASRIDKAQDLLFSGGLQLDPVAWEGRNMVWWRMQSQTHAHGSYVVVGSSMGCNCPDRAEHLGTVKFCKHTIAASAYRRILKEKLNASIAKREIDLGIHPNGEFGAYANRMGIVTLRKAGEGYAFVNATSAVRYSVWLAREQAMRWLTFSVADDVREMIAEAA